MRMKSIALRSDGWGMSSPIECQHRKTFSRNSVSKLLLPRSCCNKEGKRKHIYPRKARTVPIRLIGLSVLVLLLTNLKGLASLQRSLSLGLALLALKTEHQLLGLLRLPITPPMQPLTFLWKMGLV